MKNKKIYSEIFILLLTTTTHITGYQTITLFMKPYPKIINKQIAIKKAHKLKNLEKASKYAFRAFTQPFLSSGIFCTYGGDSAITDLNGQVTFKRLHKKPALTLIVTKNIVPVLSLENTVHHWELSRKRNIKIYSAKRK